MQSTELRSSDSCADEWPINEFSAYESNGLQRCVRAMNDTSRWDFYTQGVPLNFENEAAYKATRLRDRIQRESLLGYVESWGAEEGTPNAATGRWHRQYVARSSGWIA
jgi:hypothetical protein